MNDVEAKAELVQFAREEHTKLKAHIQELEQRNGNLRFRIEKAKAILRTSYIDNRYVKQVLAALEGK